MPRVLGMRNCIATSGGRKRMARLGSASFLCEMEAGLSMEASASSWDSAGSVTVGQIEVKDALALLRELAFVTLDRVYMANTCQLTAIAFCRSVISSSNCCSRSDST